MDLGINGRACIVTGGTSGLGAATVAILRAEGARVLVVARGASAGDGDAHLALDVTDSDAGDRAVAACLDAFGKVDALVNNAGSTRVKALAELDDADWQDQWEQHVLAPMRFMRAAVPLMAECGWGRVVNISSSSGKRPSQNYGPYSVAKAALLSLSRTYADAYAATGVRINAVAPGPLDGPLWNDPGGLADQVAAARGIDRDQALADAAAKIPIGRLGQPAEVASIVAVLCSELAANVSGAAWSVDGGAVPVII